MRILQPLGWPRPKGYANGIEARGKLIFVGGQIGWNAAQKFESHRFADQFEQALQNIIAVLSEAAAGPPHIVRMTWFITSKTQYRESLAEIGDIYRRLMGRHYPAMSVVEVTSLMEDEALVEIEATAVVPE